MKTRNRLPIGHMRQISDSTWNLCWKRKGVQHSQTIYAANKKDAELKKYDIMMDIRMNILAENNHKYQEPKPHFIDQDPDAEVISDIGFIYFMKQNDMFVNELYHHIKIGFSYESAEKRHRELKGQNSSDNLTIIGVLQGTKKQEDAVHLFFDDINIHGEWFFLTETLQEFITTHCIDENSICPIKEINP